MGCKRCTIINITKKIVGKLHPNIFEIVDVMKKQQACTEMKMERFESGATQPAWKKRYVDRDRRIRTLFDFKIESRA